MQLVVGKWVACCFVAYPIFDIWYVCIQSASAQTHEGNEYIFAEDAEHFESQPFSGSET